MRSRRRGTSLALIATAALALGLAAGPLAGGASSQTGAEATKNPLAGDGMWIWYLSRSSHGKLGAVANGADCLVLDVEGQYEGKYPQASYFMSSLRSRIGPDYPVALASFPYVDYHPALPFSVFLGPGGAQYNIPQLYWKDIGTTVDTGYIHTWVWNRIYGQSIAPLGQVYSRPKAGQIKRFRALAMSHGFDGVSWWDWQEAGKRQWKAIRQPVSPASAGPYPSYPFLHLGSKGDFMAWAQQLLAGGGYSVPVSGYFQNSTRAAVYAFQRDHGLAETGNLDVPTWGPLLQNTPLAVRWTNGGAVAAGKSGRVALP